MKTRPFTQDTTEPPAHRRRGAIIIVAMIALLVISMIGATLLKLSVAHNRQAQREQWRLQADWLAEAGLERAAARLAESAGYTGETWTIPAADLGGSRAGLVEIEITSVSDMPDRRTVSIVADYPSETDQRARARKRAVVALGIGE